VKRFRTKRKKLLLAISSWWLGSVGYLVREELLEEDQDVRCKIALSAKAGAIEILQSCFSERDFFGNVLKEINEIAESLKILSLRPNHARRIIRRGYRDHGSLRPSHQRVPTQDWSLDELQQQQEEERQITEDTLQFLLGFAGLV
jgi:hypothetical protein